MLAELDLRLAVLDAPPLAYPTPSPQLRGGTVGDEAKRLGKAPWTVFEDLALAHAQTLLPALADLRLCPPNALSIDFHTPDSNVLVGQVKSGRTADKASIDQALGAAMLPGPNAGRQHVFFYSEAGYTSGSQHLADERGFFLWHIDFYGRVLPFSAAARWLLTRVEDLQAASVEETRDVLNQAAWREAADRVAAREWVEQFVEDLWFANFGSTISVSAGGERYVLWAVEAAESVQRARMGVEEMLTAFNDAVDSLRQSVDSRSGWPPLDVVTPPGARGWTDATFETTREYLSARLSWLTHGGGEASSETLFSWPDALPREQFELIHSWSDNHWDGDYAFHMERRGELNRLNQDRRSSVRESVQWVESAAGEAFPEHVRAIKATNGGRYECAACGHRGSNTDITDYGTAPRLVTPERVWAAALRQEAAPPPLFSGFSDHPSNAHLRFEVVEG